MSEATPSAPAPMTQQQHDAAVLDSSSPLSNPLHPHHRIAKAQADALHGGPALGEADLIRSRIAVLEGDLDGPAWSERHPGHHAAKAELDDLYRRLDATQAGAQPPPAGDDGADERDVLRMTLNVNPARLTPEQVARWSARDEATFLKWGQTEGLTSAVLEPIRDFYVSVDGLPRAEAEQLFRERFTGHLSPEQIEALIEWERSSAQ